MPELFSIRETMRTVVDRGSEAVRRPLPPMTLEEYLNAVKEAHKVAGIDPQSIDPPQHMRAGVADAYQSHLQVGYETNERTGYERGLFIARTCTGSFALHGMVEAVGGKFSGSRAAVYSTESQNGWATVELTKGREGSLAPITDMITRYAEAGEFTAWVPEQSAVY